MIQTIIEYAKLIFTNYLVSIFIISGAFLFFFYTRSMPKERFPIEKKIARIAGIGYIIFGIGIFILMKFIG